MATTKRSSQILQEIHEMAADLHEIGLIDKRRMREFDALCLVTTSDTSIAASGADGPPTNACGMSRAYRRSKS